MTNLFEPPRRYVLPLTQGGDLSVDFLNALDDDADSFVDYGDGVTVTLIIDTPSPITAEADIDGYHAVVKIESAVTDTVASGITWRVVVSTPTDPTTETVAAHGKVRRYDAA